MDVQVVATTIGHDLTLWIEQIVLNPYLYNLNHYYEIEINYNLQPNYTILVLYNIL